MTVDSEMNDHLQWLADYICGGGYRFCGANFETSDGDSFTLTVAKVSSHYELNEEINRLTEQNTKLIESVEWLHSHLISDGKRYGASLKRCEIQKLLTEIKDKRNVK